MAGTPFHLREGGNAQQVRVHLAEILQSPSFVHAPQLKSFLEFLVEGVLEGRDDELKEANLGRDVFRRGAGYDPRSDAIVRVQASILRKRLAAYYEAEGVQSPIRIVLPKGGYVPQVELPTPSRLPEDRKSSGIAPEQNPSTEAVAVPAPAVISEPTRRGLIGTGMSFVAGLAVAGGGFMASEAIRGSRASTLKRGTSAFSARTVSPRIWGQLLHPDYPVQLAFGCPQFFNGDGVYVRDVNVNDTGGSSNDRIQQLSQQLQRYLTPVPNTYTGVGEMRGIHQITRFLAYEGIDADFENAQLLTLEAIQGKTLILVASHRFRTLLDLLELPKLITSSFENGGGFSALSPEGEAEKSFRSRGSGGVQESYGLVSFWNHPPTGGKILLLSGIDSWATYGAAMYITSEPHLADFESRLGSSFGPSDKGVQVLVRMDGHDNQLSAMRYHTHRIL